MKINTLQRLDKSFRNTFRETKDDVDLCLAHKGDNRMADVYIKNDWEAVDRIAKEVVDYVYENK